MTKLFLTVVMLIVLGGVIGSLARYGISAKVFSLAFILLVLATGVYMGNLGKK